MLYKSGQDGSDRVLLQRGKLEKGTCVLKAKDSIIILVLIIIDQGELERGINLLKRK